METPAIDRHPGISVVIATYNSAKTLANCLARVREQDYPQARIEILLGDGGSTDDTAAIAQRYDARLVSIPRERQNAEFNRGTAFNAARNELVLILDHDNFMPDRQYLNELVRPLLERPEVVAVESAYYHYDRSYSLLDRYYALFGTIEPVPFYFGKADRLMQTSRTWNLLGEAQDCGDYYVVRFEKDPRRVPTIGTNGCLMRRQLVVDHADVRPEYHFPIDVMVDVIRSGHDTFAFVKNSLIHLTGARGLWPFLKRRVLFVEKYHFADQARRRYSVYMPGDGWKLAKFVFLSVTLVRPTWDALRGYLAIRDPAWFVHPVMCLGITVAYGLGVLRSAWAKRE